MMDMDRLEFLGNLTSTNNYFINFIKWTFFDLIPYRNPPPVQSQRFSVSPTPDNCNDQVSISPCRLTLKARPFYLYRKFFFQWWNSLAFWSNRIPKLSSTLPERCSSVEHVLDCDPTWDSGWGEAATEATEQGQKSVRWRRSSG